MYVVVTGGNLSYINRTLEETETFLNKSRGRFSGVQESVLVLECREQFGLFLEPHPEGPIQQSYGNRFYVPD